MNELIQLLPCIFSEVSDLGNPPPFYSDTEKFNVFLEISVFSKTLRGSKINK